MRTGAVYVFYIRAWYDVNHYVIYQSRGIRTIVKPPTVNIAQKVKEVKDATSMVDLDFVTSTEDIQVSWSNIFSDTIATIARFNLSLGTFPGGSDVMKTSVSGDVKRMKLTGTLHKNKKYYTTVVAISKSGLHSQAVSDGFKVNLNTYIIMINNFI